MPDQADFGNLQTQQSNRSPVWPWLAFIGFGAFVFWHGSGIGIIDESPHAQPKHDIHFLNMAVEAFKLKYGVYPPSRILLSNDAKELDPASAVYLAAIWPRINWNEKIDWSGGVKGFKSAKLEGDQCLVYFLQGPRGEGFATNPTNPTSLGSRRAGLFFEFAQNRLVQRMKGNPFSSYKDGYGKNVYAYFSSGRKSNDYREDCPSLKVAPYFVKGSDPVRYYNRNTFQIISAGKDGIFGPGGAWSPKSAARDAGKNAADDLSNFHQEFLGK